MIRRLIQIISLGISLALLPMLAAAQDAPALSQASAAEKARLQPLIDQSKKEGELSVWDIVVDAEQMAPVIADFKAYYNLPSSFKVNYLNLSSGPMVTRLDQEISAGRVTADVASSTALPWAFERSKQGKIMQYDSPEYDAYSKIFAGGLGLKGYFAFNLCFVQIPTWNPQNLDFKGNSWRDVINAVPPGRMNTSDASKSVSSVAFYIALRDALGKDFWTSIAAMSPQFIQGGQQMVQRVVTGEDLMSLIGNPYQIYGPNQQGANLKFMWPKEGVVLFPNATFIMQGAPHPASAKLWIDYILSERGQGILLKQIAAISGRNGFKSPLSAEYAPSIDDLKIIPIDWPSITEKDMDAAQQEWISIFLKK